MAKKNKVKKTLVEQILTKAKIEHVGLQINALGGILPEGIDRSTIFKTLALKGDKTGHSYHGASFREKIGQIIGK